jgi:hypothetical protein
MLMDDHRIQVFTERLHQGPSLVVRNDEQEIRLPDYQIHTAVLALFGSLFLTDPESHEEAEDRIMRLPQAPP